MSLPVQLGLVAPEGLLQKGNLRTGLCDCINDALSLLRAEGCKIVPIRLACSEILRCPRFVSCIWQHQVFGLQFIDHLYISQPHHACLDPSTKDDLRWRHTLTKHVMACSVYENVSDGLPTVSYSYAG